MKSDQLKPIRSFKDLDVYKRARLLSIRLLRLGTEIQLADRSGIAGQIQRAAMSVPCNIAEGWGRGPSQANVNFLHISRGSLCELECLIDLGTELGRITPQDAAELEIEIAHVGRLLQAYKKSLQDALQRATAREERGSYGQLKAEDLVSSLGHSVT